MINRFCSYLAQNIKIWSNPEGLVVHAKSDVSKVKGVMNS